jgi:hypothetical protein
MKTLISRANVKGEFPTVGITDRWLFSDIRSERGAIERAVRFSQGRAYRIEFFHDEAFYNSEPFRVIEQKSLLSEVA